MSSSFRDLRVWQDAMKLASEIYRITGAFPKHELYGLSQQMRLPLFPCRATLQRGKATAQIEDS